MDIRIFHGTLSPNDIARDLINNFNRKPYIARQFNSGDKAIIQIITESNPASGGQTALTVSIKPVEDGVSVQIGKQEWLGVAASLGMTAISALRNPLSLLGRLDDLAQDIENLQLSEKVWTVIEETAKMAGASFELSERLKRSVCNYCNTPNPLGEANCLACGAPLGSSQPLTCLNCGFVLKSSESQCPNCGKPV
jgi:RNase P subunit RPR2